MACIRVCHSYYKNFDLKQYFKEGPGLSDGGNVSQPERLWREQGLPNYPTCRRSAGKISALAGKSKRVSHNSGLEGDSIQRVVQPAVTEDGKKGAV